jgi:hypothetical protein
MSNRILFHIQHNTSPDNLGIIFRVYSSTSSPSVEALAEATPLGSGNLRKNVLPFLRKMRILQEDKLTKIGQILADLSLKDETWCEAIHVWFYTLHFIYQDAYSSWAYAKVTDWLWDKGEIELNTSIRDHIVGEVIREASETFNIPQNQISFSRNSVKGVLNWLKALSKPVIFSDSKKEVFRRRDFCPMMTFLWALDAIYRENSVEYGTRLRLTEERMDKLCRICLIQPESLENLLSHTRRNLDYDMGGIFGEGFEGGFGRWVLLSKPVPAGRMI